MYQHGKKTKRKSNPKVFLNVAFVFGISLIIVAFILQKDIVNEEGQRTTVPILTEVTESLGEVVEVNEPSFSMKLPKDWVKSNRVQTDVANYYEWKSTKKGANDRILRLHMDIMPPNYKIVRLFPITPNGNMLSLGNLSVNCIDFAKDAEAQIKAQGNAPVEAKWENVTFACDPISANQTIGTGTEGSGISTKIGSHSYFFFFEDSNVYPDDNILPAVLKSFEAN